MQPDELGTALQLCHHAMVDARERLSKEYQWQESDARLTVFNKCSNVTRCAMFSMVFLDRHFTHENWWIANMNTVHTEDHIQGAINEYFMFNRVAFIQGLFYAMESSFRIYIRAIDQESKLHTAKSFQKVYNGLLKKLSLKEYLPLLDLFRTVRNVMHNNGLFCPSSGKDKSLHFDDNEYKFVVGKTCRFVDDEFVIKLTLHIVRMTIDVVSCEKLSSNFHITDPCWD